MKEGKLKDYCQVIAGQSPNGSAYNESGEGMEFHQGKKAFGEYVIQSSNVWTTEITKIAEKGDILMSVRAPVGPTNMTDRKICIGRGLAAIRCSNKVLPHFVLYALKNIECRIVGNDGAVFNSINKKMIEDLPLPQCTIAEQERIVERLDAAFAQIDELKSNAERQLAEARALFQSALKEMLEPKDGWMEKTLKEVCSLITDGTHHSPPNDEKGKYKYITAKNIRIWGLDTSNITYVSEEIHKEIIARCNPKKGDVLYIKDGATTGIAIVNPLEEEFSMLSSVALIRPYKDVLSSEFLCYTLNSPSIYNQARNQMDGAAITRVTLVKIKGFVVSIPPIIEQQRIVTRLDSLKSKVNCLEENFTKISQECDALKQALLRQIFE